MSLENLISEGRLDEAEKRLSQMKRKTFRTDYLRNLILKKRGMHFEQLQILEIMLDQYGGNPIYRIKILISRGSAYFNLGMLTEMEETVDSCLHEIYNNLNDESIDLFPRVLLLQGILTSKRGDQLSSIAYFFKAAEFFLELGDRMHAALALNNAGYSNVLLGNIPESLEFYRRSVTINRRENKVDLGRTYANIGLAYHYTYEDQKAIRYLKLAIKILDQVNPVEASLSVFNLIYVHTDLNELDEARSLMEKLEGYIQMSSNPVIPVRMEMALAMIERRVNTYKSQLSAIKRFKTILDNRFALPLYHKLAGVFISETLLDEAIKMRNEHLLGELICYIEGVRRVGEREGSQITVVNTEIMLSKIYFLIRDLKLAVKYSRYAMNSVNGLGSEKQKRRVIREIQILMTIIRGYKDMRDDVWHHIEVLQISQNLWDIRRDTSTGAKIMEEPIVLILYGENGLIHDKISFTDNIELEENMISSMLQAINLFFKSVFHEVSDIREISSYGFKIHSRNMGNLTISYIFKGRSTMVEYKLKRIVDVLYNYNRNRYTYKAVKLDNKTKQLIRNEIYLDYWEEDIMTLDDLAAMD